jgi:NADH-quinone oxidoreductase subunit N
MNDIPLAINILSVLIGALGALLMLAGTFKAARAGKGFDALAYMVLAGLGYVLLGLAAGLRAPGSLGLRAALVQLIAMIGAAVLGLLCSKDGGKEEDAGSRGLGTAGLFLCWFSLIGLPPTVGFHGKLLVYRSLLQAEWGGLFWLALLGTAAALLPAFQAFVIARPRALKGGRAVFVMLLITLILMLGMYPGALTNLMAYLAK